MGETFDTLGVSNTYKLIQIFKVYLSKQLILNSSNTCSDYSLAAIITVQAIAWILLNKHRITQNFHYWWDRMCIAFDRFFSKIWVIDYTYSILEILNVAIFICRLWETQSKDSIKIFILNKIRKILFTIPDWDVTANQSKSLTPNHFRGSK